MALRECEMCGGEFNAERRTAKFCSDRCRYRKNSRAGKRQRIPNDLRFHVLYRDGFACRYCGLRPPKKELKVDHLVPIAEGGSPMAVANMVTACGDCNDGKRDMVIDPRLVPPPAED